MHRHLIEKREPLSVPRKRLDDEWLRTVSNRTGNARVSYGKRGDSGGRDTQRTGPKAPAVDSASSKHTSLPKLEILDQSTPSKPDNFRVSPATPLPNWDQDDAWNAIDHDSAQSRESALENPYIHPLDSELTEPPTEKGIEAVLADWSGRGAHVDFQNHDEVPLVQGRFLGHGSMGGVFETTVQGYTFAWKRRFCRHRIGEAERKELEILKKVSHRHIIRLAGSYTHRQFLGVLLYPVAICDLATFLEDWDAILMNSPEDHAREEREERMIRLGVRRGTFEKEDMFDASSILISRMGCIISAVEYLHSQSIRHKDLKPSNILLSTGRLFLTDFGSATDFSDRTMSTTEGIERGTQKYFAPEMAAYEGVGRSADIFSLGCVLLEMHAAVQLQPGIETLRSLRSKHDKSFQANLQPISEWLSTTMGSEGVLDYQIKDQVRRMLGKNPTGRPTIAEVRNSFTVIDAFQEHYGRTRLFMGCCGNSYVSKGTHEQGLKTAYSNGKEDTRAEMQTTIDELRRERNDLQQRVIELQETVEQQTWSLDAWVQRDGVRLNEEAQMNDARAETRSDELSVGYTARRLRKREPLPPEVFSRPSSPPPHHCRVCNVLCDTPDELVKHSASEHGLTAAQAVLPPQLIRELLKNGLPSAKPAEERKGPVHCVYCLFSGMWGISELRLHHALECSGSRGKGPHTSGWYR